MMKRILGSMAIFGLVVGCAASSEEGVGTSEQGLRRPLTDVGPPEPVENSGAVLDADGDCSVSCGEGTYACCNENGDSTDTCKCIANGVPKSCDVGGAGASACSSPSQNMQ